MGLADSGIYLPPDYKTLQPPAAGTSYVCPVFGTTIKRLTDSIGGGKVVPVYSETSSSNLDDTFMVLLIGGGALGLYRNDGSSTRLQTAGGVTLGMGNDPKWSRINPNWIYYIGSGRTQIRRLDVVTGEAIDIGSPFADAITFGNGKGDISDNDRVAIVRGERFVSIYDLANGAQFAEVDTEGSFPKSGIVSKDGESFIIGYGSNGTGRGQGGEQFDADGSFVVQILNSFGHSSMGRDVDGSPVVFASNAATNPQQPPGCRAGVVKISLDGNAERTCLLSLTWGLDMHLSGSDGWVCVSTGDPEAKPIPADPGDTTSRDGLWHPYTNEILSVRADGSGIERLAHHRSSIVGYWQYAHANVSASGNRIVYGSDFMLAPHNDYADTYVIDLGEPTDPPTTPGDEMTDLSNRKEALDGAGLPYQEKIISTTTTITRLEIEAPAEADGEIVELYDNDGKLVDFE